MRDQQEHASRFFFGRATSLTVTLKILAELHVGFDDVTKPYDAAGAA